MPDSPSAFIFTKMGKDENSGKGQEKDVGLCLARNAKNWVVSHEGFMYHLSVHNGRPMMAGAEPPINIQLWSLDLSVNICTCNLGPNLMNCNAYFDALLEGADGQRVKAHRNVLVAQSEYFRKVLGPKDSSTHSSPIQLPDDTATIAWMVEYLYTGKFPLLQQQCGTCEVHGDGGKLQQNASKRHASKVFVDEDGAEVAEVIDDGLSQQDAEDIRDVMALWVLADRCRLEELSTWCKRHALRMVDWQSAFAWYSACVPYKDLCRPVLLKCLYHIVDNLLDVENDNPDLMVDLLNFTCPKLKAMLAQVLFAFYPTESDMIMFRMIAIQEGVDMQAKLIEWLLKKRHEHLSNDEESKKILDKERESFLRGDSTPARNVKRRVALDYKKPETAYPVLSFGAV